MCAIYDAEPFYEGGQSRKLTATEPVTCTECERTIRVGEPYETVRGKIDEGADWEGWRTCQHCRAAGVWLDEVCGGYPLTTLRWYALNTVAGELSAAQSKACHRCHWGQS